MPRPNWRQPLPHKLTIPDLVTLTTLADVRALIGKLPAEHRARSTWQHVAACAREAAAGEGDVADAEMALRLVLMLERVPCRVSR